MKHEFVTYEQASTLKELGFDEDCFGYYGNSEECSIIVLELRTISQEGDLAKRICTAPLKQQAFKFFRDKYKLDCIIVPIGDSNLKTICYCYEILMDKSTPNIESEDFKTYEEAEDACIDKLIEVIRK